MKQQGFQQNMIGTTTEKRRRQIIIIIACAGMLAGFLTLLTIPIFADPNETLLETLRYPAVAQIFSGTLLGMFFCALSLLLSKRKTMLPGIVMVLGITITLLMSDDFFQIAGGRSTIYLALPILAAAITIQPAATFAVSGFLTLYLMDPPGGLMYVNVYTLSAIWMLALCVWLATSIMEKAIITAQMETQRVRAMLGIVSHELRTPLGSISGYLDLMMLGRNESDMQFEMLTRVKASTKALIAMVNRLLDSAHIQSGKLDLKPVSTPTKSIFDTITQTVEKQALEKGLEFKVDIHDMPDVIVVDSIRLQQVIANLLDNAVKYTESGKVSLEVVGMDNKMQIVVRDTGQGIAPQNIRMIFQEFSQVQHYTTRDHGGVGLGLFIVHSLVQLMGGSIRVESKAGEGSAFIVTLPLLLSN